MLQLKFDLGLFDNPYVDEELAEKGVGTLENVATTKRVALESAILLENDGILPFDESIKKVAVIGPNADNMYAQLGDYTAPQDPERIVTMLEGIRDKGRAEVAYAKGCAVRDEDDADIEEAVKAARSAYGLWRGLRPFQFEAVGPSRGTDAANLYPWKTCGDGVCLRSTHGYEPGL